MQYVFFFIFYLLSNQALFGNKCQFRILPKVTFSIFAFNISQNSYVISHKESSA